MRDNIKKLILFTIGNGFSKLLPLIVGIILSRYYDPKSYSLFVESLVSSNMVITLIGVGFGGQLFINDFSPKRKNSTWITGVLLLVLFTFLALVLGWFENTFFCVLYSLGAGLAHMNNSLVNGQLKYFYSFLFWITIVFAISLAFLLNKLLDINSDPLNYYVIIFILTSTIYTLTLLKKKKLILEWDKKYKSDILKSGLNLGFFSAIFVFGNSLIFRYMKGGEGELALYALGYQIFSIVIFIPTMLTGYVLPLITSKKLLSKSTLLHKILILKAIYSTISFSLITIIFLLKDGIFEIYRIKADNSDLIFGLMLIGGGFYTLSYSVAHINNSIKRFRILSLSSFFWIFALIIQFIYLFVFNNKIITVKNCAIVFCISYALHYFFLMVEFLFYYNKKKVIT